MYAEPLKTRRHVYIVSVKFFARVHCFGLCMTKAGLNVIVDKSQMMIPINFKVIFLCMLCDYCDCTERLLKECSIVNWYSCRICCGDERCLSYMSALYCVCYRKLAGAHNATHNQFCIC